ncbi:MAG TPA: calcium/proton exchanger [Candidatus Acidoferrales bacterium]|nr:calcium/proton exchanger [Candidatus Acidoferrales bacterium]
MARATRTRGGLRPSLDWLLVLVPVSLGAAILYRDQVFIFVSSALAIVPLAGLLGRSTEELAKRAGPKVGGLLNATFGNLTELILAILLLLAGEFEVVKASLIGSVLGNLLLVLGLSFLVGGVRFKEQTFNSRAAGVHATSMLLAVMGLMMPALFVLTNPGQGPDRREVISVVVAVVLIALYGAALVFTLRTHEHLFRTPGKGEVPDWSLRRAVLVLLGAAVLVGIESELLVSSLEPAVHGLGLPKLFVGLILVPIIGNAAEHSSALLFALKDKIDVALEISIGSSTQIALFVAPALVFISLLIGHPMDFIFSPFQVAAVAIATVIMAIVSLDGRSNWLEGAELVGAYAIVAVSFFYLGT